VNLHTGATVDQEPTNLNWGDVDTNVFDSDTLLIPVDPTALGMDPKAASFPITYQVGTFSAYTGGDIDTSRPVAYDVADPAIVVDSPLYLDKGGVTIPYSLGSDATKDTKALVLHLQGAPGQRAETVAVTSPKPVHVKPGKKHSSNSPWKENHSHWSASQNAHS
jgi:hypothetical protein